MTPDYGLFNGTYDICGECGCTYGTPKSVMGMWTGECAICGQVRGLGNAKHDFGLSDEEVEAICANRPCV